MSDQAFIEFLAKNRAILFGDFELKSGRNSPFFINTGALCDGYTSYILGTYFAKKITEIWNGEIDVIYGPAYKGIPLAVSTSIALQKEFGITKPWLFDRKEKKTYGDASAFVGADVDVAARAVVLDDVFTTGAAKTEAIQKLRKNNIEIAGIITAVDRQERGFRYSAVEEFIKKTGVEVYSLTNISEIFEYLKNRPIDGTVHVDSKAYEMFLEYKKKYG